MASPSPDLSAEAAISPHDVESVRAWIAGWSDEVAAVDFDSASRRFASDVSAFGTHADVIIGLDRLVAEQWQQIWPAIEDFRFQSEDLQVLLSPDRRQAVAVLPWTSTGIGLDGDRFDRPGRATVVLRRPSPGDPWVGVHTHLSLGRGVPQTTHGRRAPRQ